MLSTFTLKRTLVKGLLFPLLVLSLLLSQHVQAHNVTGYSAGCATGPVYKVDPVVNSVNTGSNYAWQYKNTAGNWVCIVNGTNTIRGNSYSVEGATSTATTNPSPIVFKNPNSALDGLVIRCVISDGTGVNPCTTPSGNTWNSGSNSVNHEVEVSNTPCSPASVLQLGNRVWYDEDGDGINDGEDGIAGLTVRLYKDENNDDNADGSSIATDVTDADGYYSFAGLAPGNYIVGVVTPAGYVSSPINGGDPDDNINFDDNGQVTAGTETRGLAITLSVGAEPDGNKTNTNNNITYDFGFRPDCSCVNSSANLLHNGNFEDGTGSWNWNTTKTTFSTGTGYVVCGAKNAFNDWKSGVSEVWQEVEVTPGSTLTFKGFAGTHTAGIGCAPKLSLLFYNENTYLSRSDVLVDRDVDKNHNQLAQYTIVALVPSTATKVRVQSSISCDYVKMDAFCLTSACATPVTPTATVTQPTCTVATGKVVLSNLPSGNWTISGTDNGTPFSFAGAGSTYTFSSVDPGTYIYKVSVAGGCTSAPVTTIVNNQPVTPAAPAATVTQPTCTVATGGVVLSNLPSGNWIVTRYPGGTTYTGSGSTGSINGLATGTYTFTVTNASGCVSPATGNVVIHSQPTPPTTPGYTPTQPTCTLSTGSIAFSGLPSGSWTLTQKLGNATTTITGSTTTATISGLAPGTYTYTVTNAAGCVSAATGNIVINTPPASPAAPVATVTQAVCNSSLGVILLSGLPASGTWTLTRTASGGPTGTTTTNGTGTTAVVRSLVIGTYTFTVKNADGCTSAATIVPIAGQNASAKLGGYVWDDKNKNGINDETNTGLNNVTVSLYRDTDADGQVDGAAIDAQKSANGRYLFGSVCPGNYIIGFGAAEGFRRTIQLNTKSKDENDSDPNPDNGFTPTINLLDGVLDNTNDAGYYAPTLLPVGFGAMAAQARNCEVMLSFEVLSQKNTKQFEIQSSKDGSTWNNIGIVSAKASSSTAYQYSFTHTQPAIGVNLYRIKVVDADGKISYSGVMTATSVCAGKGRITTYPNPAFDMLNVSLPAAYQEAQLQLFSGTGQLVVSDAKKGGLVRSLNTSHLTPGIYLLKVVHNNNVVMTQKVVKGE